MAFESKALDLESDGMDFPNYVGQAVSGDP